MNHTAYKKSIKRIIDIVLSAIGLIVAAIPLIILVIAVKLDSKGPAFFKQPRLGYKGKVFNCLKLRSMVVNAEHIGSGVYSDKNDTRVTKVGRVIRATSLDEIPQLINILVGDRGIIGTTKKNIDFSSVVTA